MGLLRSEEMKQGVLMLPGQVKEARKIVDMIGKECTMQFEDMNSRDMRRPYRKYVQRIDEMERIVRYLAAEFQQVGGCNIIKNKVEEFLTSDNTYSLDAVEAELTNTYKQFVSSKENNAALVLQRNLAREEKEVVSRAVSLMQGGQGQSGNLNEPLIGEDVSGRLRTIAGVVPVKEEQKLRMALFRASRGNAFADFFQVAKPLVDPKTGEAVPKSVFVVYFQGTAGGSAPMQQKIMKVCQAMGVGLYDWPMDQSEAVVRNAQLEKALLEKEKALKGFDTFMRMEMENFTQPLNGANSKIEEYRLFCIKEKSIFTVLNLCKGDVTLHVNVWYPAADHSKIKEKLAALKSDDQNALLVPFKGAPTTQPPTFTKTNEFTEPWQDVIDTYGVPRYQEANPALFAVFTFPFIFGMMYGDIGHGGMLFMFGVYLVRKGAAFKYSVPELYYARYLVLQLGFYATFAGFLYNDLFSVGLQLFDSSFKLKTNSSLDYEPSGEQCSYPFGLDWAWVGAANELLYVNSLKMKLSVLFGVLQMMVGIVLRWSNAFFEGNMIDFIFEGLPFMMFIGCFFGWMDFMILYKWTHPIDNPPSIINSLICMGMGQEDTMPIFEGSVELSKMLMKFALLAVPLFLIPKPFLLYLQNSKSAKKSDDYMELDEEHAAPAGGGGHGHGHGEEFDISEVIIHQVIETIEMVLNTTSHTASYLRIWALSLAHQQLSLVFFQKTLAMALTSTSGPIVSGIMMYFLFAAWFGVTVAVLLGMDVLECFLHTLRLHWVEFNSKFYKADGYKFEPYDIKKLVTTGDD